MPAALHIVLELSTITIIVVQLSHKLHHNYRSARDCTPMATFYYYYFLFELLQKNKSFPSENTFQMLIHFCLPLIRKRHFVVCPVDKVTLIYDLYQTFRCNTGRESLAVKFRSRSCVFHSWLRFCGFQLFPQGSYTITFIDSIAFRGNAVTWWLTFLVLSWSANLEIVKFFRQSNS